MTLPLLLACFVVVLLLAVGSVAEAAEEPPGAQRVAQIAAMLPARAEGLGQPCSDREAWQTLAALPQWQNVVERAQGLLDDPLPEQPDDLYLDFSRTGNRTRWQRVSGQRRGRLAPLVLAECLENKGQFIPALESLVQALCAERTWVMPAHDRSLTNFEGKTTDIDLASAALGWNMATAVHLLGEKLSAETRSLIADNLSRRVLAPYRDMYSGARAPNWWMKTTNNWNAVCLAGVTGAALAQLDDPSQRAEYVAAAEKYSLNFLRGFTSDGYCSEGLGYWNYGFGHYVLLAETIHQATGGGVDLFALPQVRMPASFGARIQIIGGIAPAFADCSVNARPATNTMYYANRRLGLGLGEYDELRPGPPGGSLFDAMIFTFPNSASEAAAATQAANGPGLRTWFDQAGILIGRPAEGSQCRLAVALKGGHNAEHHNHNDVGSYVVVAGSRPVLLDPGAETYTARTFSNRRYDSKLLNSYGHPVPVVAGKLQRTGRQAKGEVLQSDFTDNRDTLRLDFKSAYDVPELEQLERTFAYSREGAGSLTITDRVQFDSPQTFGTALITRGGWLQQEDGSLVIYEMDEALKVQIDTGGAEFSLDAEQIHEEAAVHPFRLGINLTEPVTEAAVTVMITPMAIVEEEGASLLRNGGFELGSWCWDIPADGISALSDERAAGGSHCLKIADDQKGKGSNVSSARIGAPGAGRYLLRGKSFHVSGSGVGMYVRLLDEGGALLNPRDKKGNMPSIGSLPGTQGVWEDFEYAFETTAETRYIQVWIHSYNAAQVEAYVDELQIVHDGAE